MTLTGLDKVQFKYLPIKRQKSVRRTVPVAGGGGEVFWVKVLNCF